MDVGLDRLALLTKVCARIENARFGLLAHPASVDRRLVHAADVLAGLGLQPAIYFGPEHGYGGEAQDMASVGSSVDARTGARIVSLYGDSFEDLSPKRDDLDGLEALVIDLADIGSRYYTFVWTALLAVRAAAAAGVHVIILDRPNPIGGQAYEGRTQNAGYLSFVGLEPVPIRHALTLGEIVAHFADRDGLALGPSGAVSIVAATGLPRQTLATAWDRAFIMPSPNMPTFETALVYPGGCLIEGTNLSEGRGTTRPFEIFGAPFIDGRALARALEETRLPGFVARPLSFQPTFQKHAGKRCGGVQIHVTDPRTFRPVATYAAAIAISRRQAPDHFRFRTERYEYVDDIPAFDLLTGSDEARKAIEAGASPLEVAEFVSRADPSWSDQIAAAEARARAAAWAAA